MIKRLFLCFFITGLFFKSHATHIVGGEFTYTNISGNNFELKLRLFRDCNGTAGFDPTITVGVFDRVTNQLTDSLVMQLTSSDSLHLAGSLCSPPPDICVENGTYIENIVLPDNPNGYYLSWERCCRNHTVVNIDNPGATGLSFYLEMPDPALQNSSPYFQNDPLPYMCESFPFEYNFGALDPDGDVLVYELIHPSSGNSSQSFPILPTPQPGPYSNAIFAPGYSLGNICGGIPLTVNQTTGDLTATPNSIGIFAMALLVKEFRNGIQIGSIRREIEFTVIICDGNAPPEVTSFSNGQLPGTTHFEILEGDSLCFEISSSDTNDSLYITYSGDCFSGSIAPPFATASNAAGFKSAKTKFCWQTACGQSRPTPYTVDFEIKDNGCPHPETTKINISILVKPMPLVEPFNLICAAFEGQDVVNLYWGDTVVDSEYLSYYILFRSKNSGGFFPYDTLFSKQSGFYSDQAAYDFANNNYCYYLQSVNGCSKTGDNSDTLCTDDSKNDRPPYIESVSVTGNNKIQITIETIADAAYYTFYLYRRENDSIGSFSLIKTLPGLQGNTIIDEEVMTHEKSYCYYIVNQDPCGNLSPESNEACSILLTGSSAPFIHRMHWTEYINWRGGVFDYEIYRKSDDQQLFSKLTNVEYVVFDLEDQDLNYDHGKYTYQVKGIEGPGGNQAESFSNELELNQQPLVFIPNAFTPNSDNANESWGVSTIFINDYTLRIFNRYGQVIFLSHDKHQKWDGTFQGQPAGQGVFIYDLHYNSFYDDKVLRKTGTITLLR